MPVEKMILAVWIAGWVWAIRRTIWYALQDIGDMARAMLFGGIVGLGLGWAWPLLLLYDVSKRHPGLVASAPPEVKKFERQERRLREVTAESDARSHRIARLETENRRLDQLLESERGNAGTGEIHPGAAGS